MSVQYLSNISGDSNIRAEFKYGYFELSFEGPTSIFVKEFEGMLVDFITEVIEDYDKTVHPDPDKRYRECLAEWYAETTLIDYPDRFRKENEDDQN